MTQEQIELAGYRIALHKDWLALYRESVQHKAAGLEDDMKELWENMDAIEAEIKVLCPSFDKLPALFDPNDLISKTIEPV